jgi:hypothetical protein
VYLELDSTAIGTAKDVVKEAILFILHAIRTDVVHRAGDQYKLDDEIRGQILIGGSCAASSMAISSMVCAKKATTP